MDTASREVLGKATARLAHEIKNSLTGIVGALEVLQDRLSPTTEIDDIMERVGAEVQRIEGSVKELSPTRRSPETIHRAPRRPRTLVIPAR